MLDIANKDKNWNQNKKSLILAHFTNKSKVWVKSDVLDEKATTIKRFDLGKND